VSLSPVKHGGKDKKSHELCASSQNQEPKIKSHLPRVINHKSPNPHKSMTPVPAITDLTSIENRPPPMGSDCRRALAAKQLDRKSTLTLLLVFLLSLPLLNPWVRGDGVGYYAYIRSLLVEHKLDFQNDWRAGNLSFTMGRVHADGTIDPLQYTHTGHLNNHFSVGPSILWAPFVVPVHLAMLTLEKFGVHVRPNGYSRPYIVVMAFATALYGFLGLCLSFRIACLYTEERWALLATLGIWFASSLPVYMYFNPSWSHAHSVFIVAAFLWYWHWTHHGRTFAQWVILGLISGLVLDVYYANIAVLLVPLGESLWGYWRGWTARGPDWRMLRRLFAANLLYSCATLMAFLPTLVTRQIIYGHPLDFGYENLPHWRWVSPYVGSALFSSDHGLLVWTPIIILAVAGLFLFLKRDREVATYFVVVFVAFCYLIGGDPNWDGISSFGNRFFISLTPLFVLGLAVLFSELTGLLKKERAALALASSMTGLLIAWNLAFIFQWGTHMVPARGPISWRQMVHNQFQAVPRRAVAVFEAYLHHRGALMQQIEQEDVQQLKQESEASTPR